MAARLAAIDLGATSGRVMAVDISPDLLRCVQVARFANEPVTAGNVLYWDILALWRGVIGGLAAARPWDGVGVDSWAVDYALLDAEGELLGNPRHYRGVDTAAAMAEVDQMLSPAEHYSLTGLQRQPFNTLYQLAARRRSGATEVARHLLMIPDLIAFWLTDQVCGEVTNASTTGLVDPRARRWSTSLIRRLDLSPELLPPLVEPGQVIGRLSSTVGAMVGQERVPVVAVGSHDTASAVVGTPLPDGGGGVFISCGTWSLVGMELGAPVLSEEGRRANFTNELGIDGTVRYLRNVMGLWLLSESMREWARRGVGIGLDDLLASVREVPPLTCVIDAGACELMTPGDLPARIAELARSSSLRTPRTQAEFARCILDSLALAHRRAVRDVQRLTGRAAQVVHLVGGGALNQVLCQATADACGLPVVAGPVEAAALGNALVQARALGAIGGGLGEMRRLVRATQTLRTYYPRGDSRQWEAVDDRVGAGA